MVVKGKGALDRRSLITLAMLILLILGAVILYLYARTYAKAARIGITMTQATFQSILSRSLPALLGMGTAAVLIAFVSLCFQTIAHSRLLTPSMIGFDAVFVATQTLLVFLFGSNTRLFTNPYLNYGISAGMMVLISVLMYSLILRRNHNNLVFLLMFGLVLSGVLRSGTRYLQIIMTEQDFMQVQAATSVTINNMNTRIMYLAVPLMLAIAGAILTQHRVLNVLSLGSDNAKSLGVAPQKTAHLSLVLIALGMSLSTALIGSLAFLGLLAVNIAREILKTYKHLPLFLCSAAVAVLALLLGQALVELLQGAVPVTAIIDLVGCAYMFYLILKENRL